MKNKELSLKELLMYGKCIHCQKGNFDKCKGEGKFAFIDFSNGKRRWFCNVACAVLFLAKKYNKSLTKVFKQAYRGFVVGGLKQ